MYTSFFNGVEVLYSLFAFRVAEIERYCKMKLFKRKDENDNCNN